MEQFYFMRLYDMKMYCHNRPYKDNYKSYAMNPTFNHSAA